MKRFIITNLLAVITLPMLACWGGWTTNYYLFSTYERTDFSDRMDEITLKNWKAYLGLGDDQSFWFNADDIIKAAQGKNDQLMVSYVENLQKYLDCGRIEARKQWEWNYPTKEEIDASNKTLMAIRTYAQGKLKTRLRSQHALLLMRCNMMLGKHQDNITFWEQTASQYIETVYKDMMKNIYAGALYKAGQTDKAGELFAEMGDYASLMTIYYKKRSFAAIRQEYQKNPNAKVLPFLLQDLGTMPRRPTTPPIRMQRGQAANSSSVTSRKPRFCRCATSANRLSAKVRQRRPSSGRVRRHGWSICLAASSKPSQTLPDRKSVV